jgi:hypothetical protein
MKKKKKAKKKKEKTIIVWGSSGEAKPKAVMAEGIRL